MCMGMCGYALALPGVKVLGATLDVHTLQCASLAIMLGYQSLLFSLFAKTFGVTAGLLPPSPQLNSLLNVITLERGLAAGLSAFVVGLSLLIVAANHWWLVNFGPLDYSKTMRVVIPGTLLTSLGFQTVLGSFFISVLGMRRNECH